MKRKMIVRFSLTMLIEEDFEMNGHHELSHPQPELEDEDICNEIVVMPEQADLAFSKKYSIIFFWSPFYSF